MQASFLVAIPTFAASCLSFLSCATFAAFYLFFAPAERHLRQYLVLNLLVSDLLNNLNNTISGGVALYAISKGSALTDGPPCTANAYIGQYTVQATDFNILLISVVVLLTMLDYQLPGRPSKHQIALFCAAPWIPPTITANIALGLHAYGPTSGNWCWITTRHVALRYALTHGWRIAIFLTTVGIYTFVYFRLVRLYGNIWARPTGPPTTEEESQLRSLPGFSHTTPRDHSQHPGTLNEMRREFSLPAKQSEDCESAAGTSSYNTYVRRTKELRKFLLLNGYPILWIILWIPGMANRVVELSGPSPQWLQVLQASTQLVGLANVITYAFTEKWFKSCRKRILTKTGFAPMP